MDKELENIKDIILKQLIERRNEYQISFSDLDHSVFMHKVNTAFKSIIKEGRFRLKSQEQDEILGDIVSYFLGLGPIDKLLDDPDISEIMINGPKEVYVEKKGSIELTDITFKDEGQLVYFIDRILSQQGRRVSELDPYVDATLSDGSRINIVRSPVSSMGPVLTIRKFSQRILSADDLIGLGTLNKTAADFLKACIISRLNILVSGGAGSGKTTLLNVLGSFIPREERVITVEDTRELRFSGKHVIYLLTRPANLEGKAEISIRSLLRNSLHMRPDRIIVGEVRSSEVLDMIQAMNTGHEGSMTTLHANSSLEALDRLEILVLMGSHNMSGEVAKRQIINAIDLIVQMTRFSDGSRKIIEISEVVKSKEYLLEDIFSFNKENAQKGLKFTGKIPSFSNRLKEKASYSCDNSLRG